MATDTEAVLSVRGVTLRFGGLTSLDHVDLTLKRGEVLAVIGPNGAGKTSLFNCLTGVYFPQEGTIGYVAEPGGPALSLRGRKPHLVNRAGVSRTFQNIRLFNALTVLENVQIAAETRTSSGPIGIMLGLPRNRAADRAARKKARDMLAFVGLHGKEQELAASLSYGDQRRLEIARALASDPKVLLLDEPAAGVPREESPELFTAINSLSQDITVLFIEHDMELVFRLASRIIVMVGGAILLEGTPKEIAADPRVREVYLGGGKERAHG
jgi:branched-chain amino acid transport system ATP-binding protein